MTTQYFETKNQYLAFRAEWAKAAQEGNLTAAHHVLLNILRGHPIDRGFAPITSKNKLMNGTRINHGLYFAADTLNGFINRAKDFVQKRDSSFFGKKKEPDFWLEKFLKPLSKTLTVDFLANIEPTEVKPLESNYGKGTRIAKKIIEEKLTQITFADIDALLEEAA